MFTTAQMLEWLFAFLMATASFAGFGAIGSVIISHMVPKQFHDSFIRSGVRYLLLGVTAAMLWKMPERKRVPIAAFLANANPSLVIMLVICLVWCATCSGTGFDFKPVGEKTVLEENVSKDTCINCFGCRGTGFGESDS